MIHSAALVLPMCAGPLRDGALAVRGDRVLRVGPRAAVRSAFPAAEEHRWRGMIVAGLVDACSSVQAPAPGVTARATVVTDVTESLGLPGISYVEVAGDEQEWEGGERDRVITAVREVERPRVVGLAAATGDPLVLEDLAVQARTFGLRLLADLGRHPTAALDEARLLGPLCHVTCPRPLDPGERKLLRLRRTAVAICPSAPHAGDVLALLDEGNTVAFGSCPPALEAGGRPSRDAGGCGPLAPAAAVRREIRGHGPHPHDLDRRLVEAATLGGAAALGMDDGRGRIGALCPGARADFAVYDARGRYPYGLLLAEPPCLATVVGGVIRDPAFPR
ncbi:amidohydrolase family protein [Nonomuraea maritima]|uniref:amidohydrolase family protein n=1 Tax=Nonomuraea maritima TaxID=683260 RepID=UPI00371EA920